MSGKSKGKPSTSSSRPKSTRTKSGRGTLRTCIACGKRAVHRRSAREKNRAGRLITVTLDVCAHCGERYYDLAAMRALLDYTAVKPRRTKVG